MPSDQECRHAISDYLLENSNFYNVTDTIYLEDWGIQKRQFDWCHPTGETETYCGFGYIDSDLVIFYDGD